jgi:hypothetical protein
MQDTQKIGEINGFGRLPIRLIILVTHVTPARNGLPPPRRPGKKLAAKKELLVQSIS